MTQFGKDDGLSLFATAMNFLKIAKTRERTWDPLFSVYFLLQKAPYKTSQLHRLKPPQCLPDI